MKELGEMAIPHLFRCPISLELFTDPVTLCTGQTYDRSSIEKWLAYGNLTCPVTMQELHDRSMVPNHTLRHLIHHWLHQFDHPRHSLSVSLAAAAALKHQLESKESSLENKLQALEALSQQLPPNSSCFVQLGFFPLLLKLVFPTMEEGEENIINSMFVEKALVCALQLLPFISSTELGDSLKMLKQLPPFLLLFEQGSSTIKSSLCRLVEAISSSLETKELCVMLGNMPSLLQAILQSLHHHDISEAGIRAILGLCSLEPNRENLVREGAVEALLAYISCMTSSSSSSSSSSLAMAMAMASLELLLGVDSGKEAMVRHPNGVNAIVKMVFRVSDDHPGSESAVNSLIIICCHSLQAREEAICAGVLVQLLRLLQSQCSETAKTKARMLLQLLRSTSDQQHPNHV